jgi:hypothetical protein
MEIEKLITGPGPDGGPFDADGVAALNLGEGASAKALANEEKRLIAEWHTDQYRRDRQYPNVEEQLDMIFHAGQGGDEFQATIQAVKDATPKAE